MYSTTIDSNFLQLYKTFQLKSHMDFQRKAFQTNDLFGLFRIEKMIPKNNSFVFFFHLFVTNSSYFIEFQNKEKEVLHSIPYLKDRKSWTFQPPRLPRLSTLSNYFLNPTKDKIDIQIDKINFIRPIKYTKYRHTI